MNDITHSVHADQLLGTNYIHSLTVTDLPAASVGHRFSFKVKVFTAFATDGVSSENSASIILADLPDKPSSAPLRNSATSETTVAVNISTVLGSNGSPIFSYIVEIDDGLGGDFVEL